MSRFTITAKTTPECEDFLKIKWNDETYQTIDKFIEIHNNATQEELDNCMICYRGTEKTYREFINDHVAFSNSLGFAKLSSWMVIPNGNINASRYFMKKATDCLQNARLFTMNSHLILNTDFNLGWKDGYIPQFLMRCINFGTATAWYSNTFDQLLQAVYWAYDLYKNAVDRDEQQYDDSWDAKKIMTFCTYEFVVGELKAKGITNIRKKLTSCSGKIEEVRKWANYIKHKGGIEYKYLEADDPFKIILKPIDTGDTDKDDVLGDRFALENFKSPIEIDIDEKIPVLTDAHKALLNCITDLINEINYNQYELKFGGQ